MKKSPKQSKRLTISASVAESLVRVFLTTVIDHHNRFNHAVNEIEHFLKQPLCGLELMPAEIILRLQEPIGRIIIAKDLIAMEALLKRSKIHIAEADMYLVKDYLQTYKIFLNTIWLENKPYLEKLLKQAYKDYRLQHSSDKQS